MAGLLDQGMAQQQPAQPPQQQQAQPQQGPDPRVDMDPESGPQQREQIVNAMLETLYGPMLENVDALLTESRDEPERAIGRIVASLMISVFQAINEKGSTIPPGVMVQAGMVAAQAVGELAIEMGILPPEGNGDDIEAGFMIALGEFGQAASAELSEGQRKRYAELIAAIREGKGMAQGQQQPEQQQPARPQSAPRQAQPAMANQGGV